MVVSEKRNAYNLLIKVGTMKLEWRTLGGKQEKERFVEEWADSGNRKATFIQTKKGDYYLVPYGTFNYSDIKKFRNCGKWEMPFRSHKRVVKDFGLNEKSVIGGGYLQLLEGNRSCMPKGSSESYGPVQNVGDLVGLVEKDLLS